jgi:hypothetical protein
LWSGLSIAIAASTMTGCAPQTALLPDRAPLPPNLTAPCPDLTPLTDASAAAVLRKLTEVAESYYACQRRHGALTKAVTAE